MPAPSPVQLAREALARWEYDAALDALKPHFADPEARALYVEVLTEHLGRHADALALRQPDDPPTVRQWVARAAARAGEHDLGRRLARDLPRELAADVHVARAAAAIAAAEPVVAREALSSLATADASNPALRRLHDALLTAQARATQAALVVLRRLEDSDDAEAIAQAAAPLQVWAPSHPALAAANARLADLRADDRAADRRSEALGALAERDWERLSALLDATPVGRRDEAWSALDAERRAGALSELRQRVAAGERQARLAALTHDARSELADVWPALAELADTPRDPAALLDGLEALQAASQARSAFDAADLLEPYQRAFRQHPALRRRADTVFGHARAAARADADRWRQLPAARAVEAFASLHPMTASLVREEAAGLAAEQERYRPWLAARSDIRDALRDKAPWRALVAFDAARDLPAPPGAAVDEDGLYEALGGTWHEVPASELPSALLTAEGPTTRVTRVGTSRHVATTRGGRLVLAAVEGEAARVRTLRCQEPLLVSLAERDRWDLLLPQRGWAVDPETLKLYAAIPLPEEAEGAEAAAPVGDGWVLTCLGRALEVDRSGRLVEVHSGEIVASAVPHGVHGHQRSDGVELVGDERVGLDDPDLLALAPHPDGGTLLLVDAPDGPTLVHVDGDAELWSTPLEDAWFQLDVVADQRLVLLRHQERTIEATLLPSGGPGRWMPRPHVDVVETDVRGRTAELLSLPSQVPGGLFAPPVHTDRARHEPELDEGRWADAEAVLTDQIATCSPYELTRLTLDLTAVRVCIGDLAGAAGLLESIAPEPLFEAEFIAMRDWVRALFGEGDAATLHHVRTLQRAYHTHDPHTILAAVASIPADLGSATLRVEALLDLDRTDALDFVDATLALGAATDLLPVPGCRLSFARARQVWQRAEARLGGM
jgi:hypothetical protein